VQSLQLTKPHAVMRFLDFEGEREPPLVFVHGLGGAGSAHFPRLLAEPAFAGHRLVAMDLLGHGYSDRPAEFDHSLEDHAETVAQLLDHLRLSGCAVFGHSMGGSVAITLAAQRPELVSRLMLGEANLDPGGGFVSTVIASQSESEFRDGGHEQVCERLEGLGFVVSAGSFRICSSEGLYRSAVGLVEGTRPSMRERLYEMRVPRASVFGERSLPDPDVEELPRHGVETLIVPDAGHDMTFDNPGGVAAAIQQALQM
jgi:pimeloyl-ACP methyl ester carboxylesterase